MFPTKLDFSMAPSGATFYMLAPCRCTIKDMQAVTNATESSKTITVTKGATAIGVMALNNTAGSAGTWTANSSTGDTVFDEGDAIKLVCDTLANSADIVTGWIEIDQYARESD